MIFDIMSKTFTIKTFTIMTVDRKQMLHRLNTPCFLFAVRLERVIGK